MTEAEEKAVEVLLNAGECDDEWELIYAVDRALKQGTNESIEMVNSLRDRQIIERRTNTVDGAEYSHVWWYQKGPNYPKE